jgi:TolB-like protein/class 3 adenylate cyclase
MERRLSAILAADVVGYSALMEQDEAGTFDRLRAHRKELFEPEIQKHHGRIFKLTGDGLFAEFTSVVDAVECAASLQRGLAERNASVPEDQRIDVRIGINLGEVIVEGDDRLGEGVNIAARLEQLAEPGGICVSGKVAKEVEKKLAFAFEPMGEQKVKNIVEPVPAYKVKLDHVPIRRLAKPPQSSRNWALVSAGLALLLLAGGAWWFWPEQNIDLKPSIAVLPFSNYSRDEATGRLADGLTEDVITDLARFRDLSVIARNSTMLYKDKPIDVRQVGRDLNVRYVLEGSIQRQEAKVRATAQLIDATSGAHVWSNRWDRPAGDIFAVQTEIAEAVAAALGGAMSFSVITRAELENARRQRPSDLSAYDHFLMAAEIKGQHSKELIKIGLDHAEKAVALDPLFARAYTVRGWLRFISAAAYDADWATMLEKAGADWRRAVELDPMDAEARVAHGAYLIMKGRFSEGAAHLRHAIELAPMHAQVLRAAAEQMPYLGEVEEGARLADRAIRLDPHLPPGNKNGLIEPYFYAGRFQQVIEIATSMPEETRSKWTVMDLAMSYAYLNRTNEAETAKAAYLERFGDTSAEQWLMEGQAYVRQQERDWFVNGFRQLGLPICATEAYLAKVTNPARLPECVKT